MNSPPASIGKTYGGIPRPDPESNVYATYGGRVVGKPSIIPVNLFLEKNETVINQIKSRIMQPFKPPTCCGTECMSRVQMGNSGLLETIETGVYLTNARIVCTQDMSGGEMSMPAGGNQGGGGGGAQGGKNNNFPALPRRNMLQQFPLSQLVATQYTYVRKPAGCFGSCCGSPDNIQFGTLRLFFYQYPNSTCLSTDGATGAMPESLRFFGGRNFSGIADDATNFPDMVNAAADSNPLVQFRNEQTNAMQNDLAQQYRVGGPQILVRAHEIEIKFYGEKGVGEFTLEEIIAFHSNIVNAKFELEKQSGNLKDQINIHRSDSAADLKTGFEVQPFGHKLNTSNLVVNGKIQVLRDLIGLCDDEQVIMTFDSTPTTAHSFGILVSMIFISILSVYGILFIPFSILYWLFNIYLPLIRCSSALILTQKRIVCHSIVAANKDKGFNENPTYSCVVRSVFDVKPQAAVFQHRGSGYNRKMLCGVNITDILSCCKDKHGSGCYTAVTKAGTIMLSAFKLSTPFEHTLKQMWLSDVNNSEMKGTVADEPFINLCPSSEVIIARVGQLFPDNISCWSNFKRWYYDIPYESTSYAVSPHRLFVHSCWSRGNSTNPDDQFNTKIFYTLPLSVYKNFDDVSNVPKEPSTSIQTIYPVPKVFCPGGLMQHPQSSEPGLYIRYNKNVIFLRWMDPALDQCKSFVKALVTACGRDEVVV